MEKDILAAISLEDAPVAPKQGFAEAAEPVIIFSATAETENAVLGRDILAELEDQSAGAWRLADAGKYVMGKLAFLAYYLSVSTAVFVVLMLLSNYSAYFLIASNYVNAESLTAASRKVQDSLKGATVAVDSGTGDASSLGSGTDTSGSGENAGFSAFAPSQLVNDDDARIRAGTVDVTTYENRLVIPKIGVNAPIIEVDPKNGYDFEKLETVFMDQLQNGVVHYPGTGTPGEAGNAFMFGHSSNYPWAKGDYNQVFAMLGDMEEGDEITVYYNQRQYTYTVREKTVIQPGDTQALKRDPDKKELSLMTCWPVGTTLHRLLLFAELNEDGSGSVTQKDNIPKTSH